jgi:hypothetical protein
MIIKEGFIEFIVLIPILVVVEWFRSSMKARGVKRTSYLGLETAATLEEGDGSDRIFDPDLYRQPALLQVPFKPKP